MLDPVGPTTLDELFRRFLMTPEARMSAKRTKAIRAAAFDAAIRRFGRAHPIKSCEDRIFRSQLYDWRDTFAPSMGRQHIYVISSVFNWAVDRGFMTDNPAAGMKHIKKASRAEIIWTSDDVRAFREAADEPLRNATDVALWTALREVDVIGLRSYQFNEGWLTVIPQKTRKHGVKLFLPYYLIRPLAETVGRLFAREMDGDALVLLSHLGEPWNERLLRRYVEAAREKAGVNPDLRFGDLRGTAVTWMLEAGCTDAEVGSISGHGIAKGNMRSYAARTRPLAESAYRKLAAYMGDWN